MRCKCGGEYVYEEGVIYCPECLHVIYRENDSSIHELKDYINFLIDTNFMSMYSITKFLNLSKSIGRRVYYVTKNRIDE